MGEFNKYKSEKGITIVALTLMIIITLILVGVVVKVNINQTGVEIANNIVHEAQNRINTAENQAANIDDDWQNLPGKPIKSNTMLNENM